LAVWWRNRPRPYRRQPAVANDVHTEREHPPRVPDYAKTWIRERNVKPRTRIGYESLWENHISSTLGKVPLVHLTPESVLTGYSGLGTEHIRRNSRGC
jgi:hypothetical protein